MASGRFSPGLITLGPCIVRLRLSLPSAISTSGGGGLSIVVATNRPAIGPLAAELILMDGGDAIVVDFGPDLTTGSYDLRHPLGYATTLLKKEGPRRFFRKTKSDQMFLSLKAN